MKTNELAILVTTYLICKGYEFKCKKSKSSNSYYIDFKTPNSTIRISDHLQEDRKTPEIHILNWTDMYKVYERYA